MWYRWLRSLWESQGWSNTFSVYHSLFVPAEAMYLGAISRVAVNGAVYGMGFPTGADTLADGALVLPPNYKEGTALLIDILWAPTSTDVHPLEWRMHTSHANVVSGFSAAASTVIPATPGGVAHRLQRSESANISGAKKGSVVKFTMGRYGATGADTYPHTAILLGLCCRYLIEGAGHELPRPSEV
jgi:hypothetical protein